MNEEFVKYLKTHLPYFDDTNFFETTVEEEQLKYKTPSEILAIKNESAKQFDIKYKQLKILDIVENLNIPLSEIKFTETPETPEESSEGPLEENSNDSELNSHTVPPKILEIIENEEEDAIE